MSFDRRFYNIQTKLRGLDSPEKIRTLCAAESQRIGIILRQYITIIKSSDNSIALDVPCGYGNLLHLYKEAGLSATGFDLDENQVNLAKSIGLNASVMDVFDVITTREYAAISSFDFIEHLEKGVALNLIEKFYGMLRPNGYLFLRTPSGDSPFGLRDFAEDPTHKWIGTSNSVSSLLYICGFKSVTIYEDWPIPRRFKITRLLISKALRNITKAYYWLTGFGWPRCLSSSMIIVAQK